MKWRTPVDSVESLCTLKADQQREPLGHAEATQREGPLLARTVVETIWLFST